MAGLGAREWTRAPLSGLTTARAASLAEGEFMTGVPRSLLSGAAYGRSGRGRLSTSADVTEGEKGLAREEDEGAALIKGIKRVTHGIHTQKKQTNIFLKTTRKKQQQHPPDRRKTQTRPHNILCIHACIRKEKERTINKDNNIKII